MNKQDREENVNASGNAKFDEVRRQFLKEDKTIDYDDPEEPKVVLVSGWSDPGGSTIANINLCNLFNANGINCTFYGPHKWHLDKCKSGNLNGMKLGKEDNVITHFIRPGSNLKRFCRRHVLSCHETNMYPLKKMIKEEKIKLNHYNFIHFVSDSQREWHRVFHPYKIIPNVISKLEKSTHSKQKLWNTDAPNIAGVIGSIDPHKRTHLSIKRALDDGVDKIYLFGKITDGDYFNIRVLPLMGDNVKYMGHADDKQEMYNQINKVYHSSKRETFNFIKAECELAGVQYSGLPSADSKAKYSPEEEILEMWKKALEL